MKIAYILRKFPVYSETFILNELLEIEANGNDIHLFALGIPSTPCHHEGLNQLKAKVIYVEKNISWLQGAKIFGQSFFKAYFYALFGNPELFKRLAQALPIAIQAKEEGIEHIHAHFASRASTVALFVSMLTSIPYSFTAHAVDIFRNDRSLKALRKKMEKAHFVRTISDYNVAFLKSISPNTSLVKIFNGIDLSSFHAGDPALPFTFIMVARFVEKKGHRILIEACRLLKEKGVLFRCLLVGSGSLKKQIKNTILQEQLGFSVQLLGTKTQQEVIALYKNSHAFVLPCCEGKDGNKDGLPVSIIEALASHLPVITTAVSANTEVIVDGKNGLIVAENAPEELALKMEKLIDDTQLYLHLKANARPSVEELFCIKNTTQQLLACL